MTVCCKTPALKIGSSLKIFSNNLNELPLVLIENCGYNGKTTKRVILSLLMFSIASSVNGFQYRMPTYVFTFVKPFDINDFFNASDCSSVIRLNGDPPPDGLVRLFALRRSRFAHQRRDERLQEL